MRNFDKYFEQFDPDNIPELENIDGSDIDPEAELELQKADVQSISPQPKACIFEEPAEDENKVDPYGVYEYIEVGRKVVTAISIAVALFSAVEIVISIFEGTLIAGIAATMRMIFAYLMAKGSSLGRIMVIAALIISVYSDLNVIAGKSTTSVLQALYVIILIAHAITAYLLIRDKNVRAFFGKTD